MKRNLEIIKTHWLNKKAYLEDNQGNTGYGIIKNIEYKIFPDTNFPNNANVKILFSILELDDNNNPTDNLQDIVFEIETLRIKPI